MTELNTVPGQADIAAAVHAVLSEDLHVRAALGTPPRIYDHVPSDPVHPYLTYGRVRTEDVSGDAAPRSLTTLTFHLRSRYAGKAEVMGILSTLTSTLGRDALRTRLPGVVGVTSRYADSFTARDGHSRHSVLRLAVTIDGVSQLEAVQ